MRDPNRINIVIEALRAKWLANPDLRLGQLIINLCRKYDNGEEVSAEMEGSFIFHLEDDHWLERLLK